MKLLARIPPSRALAILALVFTVLVASAMVRTSTTFDEIVFPAAGARALATGDFGMIDDHPRLAQYLLGFPVRLLDVKYPPEDGRWSWVSRYHYARALYWGMGNYPERITFATRLVGVATGLATVLAVFFLSRRHLGAGAALFAATLFAFLPDVLAHSGVAYNDIPITLALLLSAYALDAAVRLPTPARFAIAALACAAAIGVKYSGLVAGPIFAALLAAEALSGRWRDRAWRRGIVSGVAVFAAVLYAAMVAIYGGDWRLAEFFGGMREALDHVKHGRGFSLLLGEKTLGGWWYFYPVAFLLKTPVALHALIVLAFAGAWLALRGSPPRSLLAHPARAPVVGLAVFLAVLLTARINIGMRHALPALPFLCILVAQGVAPLWRRGRTGTRAALLALLAASAISGARHYPYFISYLSEYVEGRRPLYDSLVDSSTDWGHGLVALREYMAAHGIDRVALAYFGSALPEGYGIAYVPLQSFLELPAAGAGPQAPPPRFIAVSATMLAGVYSMDDPFAALRRARPVAVVGGSIYLYDREALGASRAHGAAQ